MTPIQRHQVALTDDLPADEPTGEELWAADGLLRVGPRALLWEDELGQISAKGTGPNNPSFIQFRDGIFAYEFSPTAMKEVWINFHIRHRYAPGTPVYLHAHYASKTTSTGAVRWGFEYMAAKGHQQQQFPASAFTYITQEVTGQYFHMIAEVSPAAVVPATNLEVDALILVRVFRDASHAEDTYPDPVYLFMTDLHYQAKYEGTPNKSPDFYTGA